MAGQCRFNPPAEAGMVIQGGEVEPHESDEVHHGWGEGGQALHKRGWSSLTIVHIYYPP